MAENICLVGTYFPTKCGIATFTGNLASALQRLTAEVGAVDIAAIDDEDNSYPAPVNEDLIIQKYNVPDSWTMTANRICVIAGEREGSSTIILNHEFGLDPAFRGVNGECKGKNFINMAKIFRATAEGMSKEKRILTLPILHTVPPEPNDHQKNTIQELVGYSDGVLVMTQIAKNILLSETYNIPSSKIEYIHHGVRIHNISRENEKQKRIQYKLDDRLVVASTGLMSPSKGLVELIESFSRAKKSIKRKEEANKMLLLIVGAFHPMFKKFENGKYYAEYVNKINKKLGETGLDYFKTDDVKEFIDKDFKGIDVVFLETYIPEHMLRDFYAISDIFVANHTDMDQMHSGTVPEAMGAEIPQITSKFYNALEMLADISTIEEVPYRGKIIGLDIYKGQTAGLLVDPGKDSVEQIRKALKYLVENPDEREAMGRMARSKGRRMTWASSALDFISYVRDIRSRL